MYFFESVFIFSAYMTRSWIIGSYGNSIFSFFKDPPYCSPVTEPIYIPTNSIGEFLFLNILFCIYYL